MLTTTKVVVFFLARVTGKTSLRDLLRRFVLERSHLRRIAFFYVSLAGAMASFATGRFSLPTADGGKLGMRSVREGFELILVTVLAGIATDVIFGLVGCRFSLTRLNRRLSCRLEVLGRTARSEPYDRDGQRGANEQRLDDSV